MQASSYSLTSALQTTLKLPIKLLRRAAVQWAGRAPAEAVQGQRRLKDASNASQLLITCMHHACNPQAATQAAFDMQLYDGLKDSPGTAQTQGVPAMQASCKPAERSHNLWKSQTAAQAATPTALTCSCTMGLKSGCRSSPGMALTQEGPATQASSWKSYACASTAWCAFFFEI